ncbi:ferredoxin [Candidatus Woesearchaeota archaeon]|nr:ferredoxin [Candidatus Woesearchaeota archaeon]
MAVRIQFDEDKCIGCGACASVCADNWDIVEKDNGYKAKPKAESLDEPGCNAEAADVCPVECIKVVEID